MSQENHLSNITENCYNSIDELPIYNWIKIYETADLSFLIKTKTKKIDNKGLNDLWIKLQNEYLTEFGIEPTFKQRLELMKKKAIKQYDYLLTNDRFILTEIDIIDADLKSLENNSNDGIKFWQIKEKLEQNKGFRIDPKELTVIEWYYALKELTNGKANKGNGHNREQSPI